MPQTPNPNPQGVTSGGLERSLVDILSSVPKWTPSAKVEWGREGAEPARRLLPEDEKMVPRKSVGQSGPQEK